MGLFSSVRILITLSIAAIVGVSATLVNYAGLNSEVIMWVEPTTGSVVLDETFTIYIEVIADIPVNVFKGNLQFDPAYLQVEKIDYNTSIANLWAEEPWYSNGDGSLNYTGGTTQSGGFTGRGTLVTVTFKTLKPGEVVLSLSDSHVLKHDGLGSEADLGAPIDAIFTVAPEEIAKETLFQRAMPANEFTILEKKPNLDLNNDGKQSIADVSIFMAHLVSKNTRSDFNQDGKVDLQDLSILTQ